MKKSLKPSHGWAIFAAGAISMAAPFVIAQSELPGPSGASLARGADWNDPSDVRVSTTVYLPAIYSEEEGAKDPFPRAPVLGQAARCRDAAGLDRAQAWKHSRLGHEASKAGRYEEARKQYALSEQYLKSARQGLLRGCKK